VWIDVLDELDEHGGDLSSLERIVVGGSAAPEEVTKRYDDEHDVVVEHAWGMTETMSIGSVSRPKASMKAAPRQERLTKRAKQGLLSPGLEMKLVGDDGETLPWDGESAGELLVRGPTVIEEYHNRPEANQTDFESAPGGQWLHTGDIATVDEDGYLEIVDRATDVIKSGGEWISSIELENRLMAHEDVSEAAVVAAPHERWGERPLGVVVPQAEADPDEQGLRESLVGAVPKWWLPDEIRISETLPKTATGKFDTQSIRAGLDQPELPHAPGRER
jgi:Acyl-CoA synthetases (AMP-forming)/AMP-acid ligases II